MKRRTLFTTALAAVLWPFKAKAAPVVNCATGSVLLPRKLSLFDWMAEHRPDGYCAAYKRRLAAMNFQTACGQDLIEQEQELLAHKEWSIMIL